VLNARNALDSGRTGERGGGQDPATSSPSFAPHAPFRTTGDEVEPTSLGGENKQRPLLPIVGVRDFDAGMHAACRERRLVSVKNWRNRPRLCENSSVD